MSSRHPRTLADALTEPGPLISVRSDYAGDAQHIWWLPDGRVIVQGLGRIPEKSRFRAGDRVRLHGYPGYPYSNQRHGFVGIVLGSPGADLLEGITDDGRPWVEQRGWLEPADKPVPPATSSLCTCCPHPPTVPASPELSGQLDLLDMLAGAP